MPETRKILGQQKPAASTETDLYQVPDNTQCVASTIVVCDQGGIAPITFRISITREAGFNSPDTPTSGKDYIRYDKALTANSNEDITIGITLGEYDIVRVYCNQPTVSFTMFGVELT